MSRFTELFARYSGNALPAGDDITARTPRAGNAENQGAARGPADTALFAGTVPLARAGGGANGIAPPERPANANNPGEGPPGKPVRARRAKAARTPDRPAPLLPAASLGEDRLAGEMGAFRLEGVLAGLRAAYADGALPGALARRILRYSCGSPHLFRTLGAAARAAVPFDEAEADYRRTVETCIDDMDAFAGRWHRSFEEGFADVESWAFSDVQSAAPSAAVAHAFTVQAVGDLTPPDGTVIDLAAYRLDVARAATGTGRHVRAVSPFGECRTSEGYEHTVGDLRTVAATLAEHVRAGRAERSADLLISDLSVIPAPAPLIGDLWPHMRAIVPERGTLALRVGFGQVPAVLDVLTLAASVRSLGDGTAELRVSLPSGGGWTVPAPANGNPAPAVTPRSGSPSGTGPTSVPAPASADAPVRPAQARTPAVLSAANDGGAGTLLSLFAGAGGLDMGFAWAGYRTLAAVEWDAQAAATFATNLPHAEVINTDITTVSFNRFHGGIHGIVGGPPCQGFSNAGLRLNWSDPRSLLMHEYLRAVKEVRPRFFVLENVKNLWTHRDNRPGFERLKAGYEALGYTVTHRVVNAADYGVPQTRERLIMVGIRGAKFDFDRMPKTDAWRTLGETIGHLRGRAAPNKGRDGDAIEDVFDTGGFSGRFRASNRVRGFDQPGFTMVANGRGMTLHPEPINPKIVLTAAPGTYCRNDATGTWHRRLTPREASLIQTFPDDFTFAVGSCSAAYRIVGNAVPPLLAYAIASTLRTTLAA